MFANPDNLKMPVNGTVCRVCGLVQGEGRDGCGYCGTSLMTILAGVDGCKFGWVCITKEIENGAIKSLISR